MRCVTHQVRPVRILRTSMQVVVLLHEHRHLGPDVRNLTDREFVLLQSDFRLLQVLQKRQLLCSYQPEKSGKGGDSILTDDAYRVVRTAEPYPDYWFLALFFPLYECIPWGRPEDRTALSSPQQVCPTLLYRYSSIHDKTSIHRRKRNIPVSVGPLAATSVHSRMPLSSLQNWKKEVVLFCCFCLPWMSITGMSM